MRPGISWSAGPGCKWTTSSTEMKTVLARQTDVRELDFDLDGGSGISERLAQTSERRPGG